MMDWTEATDLGQEASWLIGKLQGVFDRLAVGEIIVEPPIWEQKERRVHSGGEKKVTALVIKDHLRIAMKIELPPEGGPSDWRYGRVARPNSNKAGG